jgi:DNA invertase Pin-like site-specific DNA recombinase
MTSAAIYARYSSDLQSSASIDDQVHQCRKRADAEDWKIMKFIPIRPSVAPALYALDISR